MGMKETLDLVMSYSRIKAISFEGDKIFHVDLYPEMPTVQPINLTQTNDMPPDDVMIFAATEDVEELMKHRKAE